jgi:hypothetical protein
VTSHTDVPEAILDRLRSLCLALPETHEEPAWTGTRWMIRTKNFAHVVRIESGWPPAYAQAAGTDGPCCVVTFRCPMTEVDAYRHAGHPFFVPVWFPNIVGMILDAQTNWDEVGECITESYRELAPKKLSALLEPPTGG